MTDGIIQEVLNHYRDMRYQNYDHRSIIDLLQQELIEKILLSILVNTHAMCSCNADIEIIKMLIGDNQE